MPKNRSGINIRQYLLVFLEFLEGSKLLGVHLCLSSKCESIRILVFSLFYVYYFLVTFYVMLSLICLVYGLCVCIKA